MGGSGSKNTFYSEEVSARLQSAVRDNSIWALCVRDTNRVDVDFGFDKNNNNKKKGISVSKQDLFYEDKYFFEAQLMPNIPENSQMIFLFQHRAEESEKVMFTKTQGSLDSVNRALNRFMHKDPTTIQFCMCHGDYIYRFKGISHNVHLLWTEEISLTEDQDIEVKKFGAPTPLISYTNGHMEQIAMYPLMIGRGGATEAFFIYPERVTLVVPSGMVLYPCDTPKPKEKTVSVVALTREEARVRKERVVVPDEERHKYDLSQLGHNNGGMMTTEGEEETYYENDDNDDDDDEEEESGKIVSDMDDDAAAEFFGDILNPGKSKAQDEEVLSQIRHVGVVSDMSRELTSQSPGGSSSEPEFIDASKYTGEPKYQLKGRVPRSLIGPHAHRGPTTVIKISPRTKNRGGGRRKGSLGVTDEEASSSDASPLPSGRRPSVSRPPNVPALLASSLSKHVPVNE